MCVCIQSYGHMYIHQGKFGDSSINQQGTKLGYVAMVASVFSSKSLDWCRSKSLRKGLIRCMCHVQNGNMMQYAIMNCQQKSDLINWFFGSIFQIHEISCLALMSHFQRILRGYIPWKNTPFTTIIPSVGTSCVFTGQTCVSGRGRIPSRHHGFQYKYQPLIKKACYFN